jgi:tetratricopeptide (TPR) repeat protein
MKAKGDKYLEDSLPYLEKALELNPTDYNTLFSLKQIYSRTGQVEKYNEVNDKLKEL